MSLWVVTNYIHVDHIKLNRNEFQNQENENSKGLNFEMSSMNIQFSIFLLILCENFVFSSQQKTSLKALAYNMPPFSLYDPIRNGFSGIEINLVNLLAKKLNVTIKYDLIRPINGSRINDN